MGKIKQLLPWKDSTLLNQAIENALNTKNSDVYVVLGANATKIKTQINLKDITVLVNKDWQMGIGSSIAYGIQQLEEVGAFYKNALLMLCDQPLIDDQYLAKLITTYKGSQRGIIATSYKNRAGVPAIFEQSYFKVLKQLNKDQGAQSLLKQHSKDVILIEPEGKEIDLDTYKDYLDLLAGR